MSLWADVLKHNFIEAEPGGTSLSKTPVKKTQRQIEMGEERLRILEFLEKHGPSSTKDIASALNLKSEMVYKHLAVMHGAKKVFKQYGMLGVKGISASHALWRIR